METKQSFLNKEQKQVKNNIFKFKNNPRIFTFYKTISSNMFNKNFYNNRACIFTYYKDNNIYIVYGVISFDLECYDIINDKKFILIQKLHKDSFDSCRHFYDNINNRDLIFTSSFDKHVKILNFKRQDS